MMFRHIQATGQTGDCQSVFAVQEFFVKSFNQAMMSRAVRRLDIVFRNLWLILGQLHDRTYVIDCQRPVD